MCLCVCRSCLSYILLGGVSHVTLVLIQEIICDHLSVKSNIHLKATNIHVAEG